MGERAIRDATDAEITQEAQALATLLATDTRQTMVVVITVDDDGLTRLGHGVSKQTKVKHLLGIIEACKRQVKWLAEKAGA